MFDTDNSSKLTAGNIAIATKKFGHEIDREEIQGMIAQHDADGDGKLCIEEFEQIFFATLNAAPKIRTIQDQEWTIPKTKNG